MASPHNFKRRRKTRFYNVTRKYLKILEKVLKWCDQTHLSLSTKKFHMMMSEGIVLGHFISTAGIQVDLAKIKVIKNIPILGTQKEVRSFLGHAGYYRSFIEKKFKLASPLFTLLMKDAQFNWIDACQTTFAELKNRLSTTSIFRGPNQALPFHISTDVSDIAIGAMLGQQ